MKAYVYKAALYCEDCAESIQLDLEDGPAHRLKPSPEELASEAYDSDDWPKGPYANGGGEADSPQHCDKCGIFLENPLTADGQKYVIDAMDRPGLQTVLAEWRYFYEYLFAPSCPWPRQEGEDGPIVDLN